MTVFIVDDDPAILRALSRELARLGITVQTFARPQDALAALGSCPEAVISDQSMPGMTGMALLTEVARRCPAARRVLLSAVARVDPGVDRAQLHAVLEKPWDREALLAAIGYQPQPP